tara:strand:+ start:825 stop:1025 length:201 start_codon:yes stop_codon:yes gene_type:complete
MDALDNTETRFCELVVEINYLTQMLQRERDNFYDGGYSFEEVNKVDLDILSEKRMRLRVLIKNMTR